MTFSFYEKALKDQDVLRNKAAFALSQILVVSANDNKLNRKGLSLASYYDILYKGAFGNYRDLLMDVSLHPVMGFFLSHLKNQKGDPDNGTLPDENYAREIMQLFTIGLFELNTDGTLRLDSVGEPISSYTIEDIQELAKVFTGLSMGAYDITTYPELANEPHRFNAGFSLIDGTVSMAMFQDRHDIGEKRMIDGSVIHANQEGMKDIEDAIDVLFNHPNVGPFIGKRLIHQLVKSNPSPAYVQRVAMAFNNNGNNVRGDMEAVFKAILLDPEARDCIYLEDAKNGKLRQPIERFTNLWKAFDISSPSGKFWFSDRQVMVDQLEQAFLAAPSVFNFFSPFYAEENYVKPNEMVSPAFQILHAVTAIYYLNYAEFSIKEQPFPNRTRVRNNNPALANDNNQDKPLLDLSDEISVLETSGIEALLARINLILCQGQLSDETTLTIKNALTALQNNGFGAEDIVFNALYFIMASPDFMILE